MPRRPPETTLTATLFPYTTLFRSEVELRITGAGIERRLAVRDKPQGRTEGREQALATTGVIGINRRRPLGHIRQTLACSTAHGRRGFCKPRVLLGKGAAEGSLTAWPRGQRQLGAVDLGPVGVGD